MVIKVEIKNGDFGIDTSTKKGRMKGYKLMEQIKKLKSNGSLNSNNVTKGDKSGN